MQKYGQVNCTCADVLCGPGSWWFFMGCERLRQENQPQRAMSPGPGCQSSHRGRQGCSVLALQGRALVIDLSVPSLPWSCCSSPHPVMTLLRLGDVLSPPSSPRVLLWLEPFAVPCSNLPLGDFSGLLVFSQHLHQIWDGKEPAPLLPPRGRSSMPPLLTASTSMCRWQVPVIPPLAPPVLQQLLAQLLPSPVQFCFAHPKPQ